jgi:hypothetical protein
LNGLLQRWRKDLPPEKQGSMDEAGVRGRCSQVARVLKKYTGSDGQVCRLDFSRWQGVCVARGGGGGGQKALHNNKLHGDINLLKNKLAQIHIIRWCSHFIYK